MLKYLWIAVGVLAGTTLGFGGGYVSGIRHQKAVVAANAAAEKITILKDGKEVDEKVLSADDSGLCDLLGGC